MGGRIERSQLCHRARDHHKGVVTEGQYKNILERCLTDNWNLQSQGTTEETVTEWNRLAEGPKREHVATAETCTLVKHVLLRAAESERLPLRTRVGRQRDNTSTQQQHSNWQWQDWQGEINLCLLPETHTIQVMSPTSFYFEVVHTLCLLPTAVMKDVM